ncbi:MAG: hypothetical protein IPO82_01130 [Betaproteobacteria bacterium]|nr:hypothetical protein [Betaproteobacteria bacterium]
MTKSGIFKLVGLVVLVLLAVAAYRLLGTVVAPKIEHRIGEIGLTPNEIAANGPLPGDVSQYAKELACAQSLPTPGYYPSINGAELADAQRSGMFSCATFTGSFDGPNKVFAWRSAVEYDTTSYINNRRPGELFIGGAGAPVQRRDSRRALHRQGRRDDGPRNLAHLPRQRQCVGRVDCQYQPQHPAQRPGRHRVAKQGRLARRRHRPGPEAGDAAHRPDTRHRR